MSRKWIAILIAVVFVHACKKDEATLPYKIDLGEEVINLKDEQSEYTVCASVVTLDAGVENASYLWTPDSQSTQTIKLYSPFGGPYQVQITTVDSSWTESVYVFQQSAVYYIPNAFSPNGDNINDVFSIQASCIVASHLKVFNNFNTKLLFESTDINQGWDGMHKGNPMPPGEYPYQAEVTFIDGELVTSHGPVELIR